MKAVFIAASVAVALAIAGTFYAGWLYDRDHKPATIPDVELSNAN